MCHKHTRQHTTSLQPDHMNSEISWLASIELLDCLLSLHFLCFDTFDKNKFSSDKEQFRHAWKHESNGFYSKSTMDRYFN